MNRLIPMALLLVGTLFASAFGARNGDTHVAYRQAGWAVQEASGGIGRQASIDAMTAAMPKLDAANPETIVIETLTPKRLGELNDVLLPFGISPTQSAMETAQEDAAKTLAKAIKKHDKQTTALIESHFLKPLDSNDLRVAALKVPTASFQSVVGKKAWITVARKAENFSLGANKIKISAGEEPLSEEDIAMMAAIDDAIAGNGRGKTIAALAARGLPVDIPSDALIQHELLSGDNRASSMKALLDAGLLNTTQSYEQRLEVAEKAQTAAVLPTPRQRIAEWFALAGPLFSFGALFIGVGAILARRQIASENAGQTGGADSEQVDFYANLDTIASRLNALVANAADIQMDDTAPTLRAEIDAIQLTLIDPAVAQRGRFMARHGIASFAEYFSPFSAGERNLARAWSAFTDGHAVVARDALHRAQVAFGQADAAWKKAESELSSAQ